MDDRFKDGFDRIVAETTEGPSWEDLATSKVTSEPESPGRRTGPIVAVGAFVLAVVVVGVVAMFTSRGPVPVAADTTTTTAQSVLTEDESLGIQIWVDGLGLVQTDETIWRARYDEACSEGVWDAEVALRLGAHFVDKDLTMGVSARDPSIGDPTAEEGANALWLAALQSCRDLYPADAIAAGPPFQSPSEPEPASLRASCGAVLLGEDATPEFPDTALTPEAAQALAATDALGLEGDFFDEFDWVIADDDGNDRFVLFGTPTADVEQPGYAYATFENRDGTWEPTGWGGCNVEVEASGWGTADWVLDPDQAFDPLSDGFGILIRERECASGLPPTDREVVPVAIVEQDTVTIHVLVEPIEGDASCPSNPWFPVTVTLSESLDARDLFDGREVPPVLVWSNDGTMIGPDDR